jgi:hypothetical protein
MAGLPALGVVTIDMGIIATQLPMWMLVIVGVDVYVRLSLEISGWWRADYRKLPLHGPGSHATVTMLH